MYHEANYTFLYTEHLLLDPCYLHFETTCKLVSMGPCMRMTNISIWDRERVNSFLKSMRLRTISYKIVIDATSCIFMNTLGEPLEFPNSPDLQWICEIHILGYKVNRYNERFPIWKLASAVKL